MAGEEGKNGAGMVRLTSQSFFEILIKHSGYVSLYTLSPSRVTKLMQGVIAFFTDGREVAR
ncbi:MAG: hypothetical protein QXM43_04650 [Desulfurococcaceae archaeon]